MDSPSQLAHVAVLTENDARRVLLVRAYEEADTEGTLLTQRERARATEEARAQDPSPAGFLAGRARRLHTLLDTRARMSLRLARSSLADVHPLWIILPAAIFGWLTTRLGPDAHLNVLAFPLVGLIVWNLVMYALLCVPAMRAPRPGGGALMRAVWSRARRRAGDRATLDATALGTFFDEWREVGAPLFLSRLRAWLHIGAFTLVAFVVAGMYIDGIAKEYTAIWESTFLELPQVESLLGVVLWPATKLYGEPLPDLALMDGPPGLDAALWIHLYVITAAIYVLVPRLVLFFFERRRSAQLASAVHVDISEAYYAQLSSPARGGRSRAEIVPYSYKPGAHASDGLKAMMHDLLGARAEVRVNERLEYGDEASDAAVFQDGDEIKVCCVPLFALAQSPEAEVHGRFLEELKNRVPDDGSLLVLVDATSYRERLAEGEEGEGRLEERRRAWDRVVREAGIECVHVDLARPLSKAAFAELSRSRWPHIEKGSA